MIKLLLKRRKKKENCARMATLGLFGLNAYFLNKQRLVHLTVPKTEVQIFNLLCTELPIPLENKCFDCHKKNINGRIEITKRQL